MATELPETAILLALLGAAEQFGSAQHPPIECAMPNRAFKPVSDDKVTPSSRYLRVTYQPNTPDNEIINRPDARFNGFLQIDVFYGRDAGEPVMDRVAARVIQFFDRGTQLPAGDLTVRVDEKPYRGPLVEDGVWAFVPVRIPWQCLP